MLDQQAHPAFSRRRDTLVPAILAIGISLRVWQYLADMSMWFDELSIARNVGERSLGQLPPFATTTRTSTSTDWAARMDNDLASSIDARSFLVAL